MREMITPKNLPNELTNSVDTPVPASEVAECRHLPWRRCPVPAIPGLAASYGIFIDFKKIFKCE